MKSFQFILPLLGGSFTIKKSLSENDFSNCESREQFLEQYEFLIKEISRLTKPGRISAVHIADIINKDGGLYDLPNEVIKIHERNGFKYRNRITIWKEPLKVSDENYGSVLNAQIDC